MALPDLVAERQARMSKTAGALKSRLDTARWTFFAASIGGAAMAAIASALAEGAERNYLAWAGAAVLVVATFVTAQFLSRSAVALYVTARNASEALKREAFLYATSAPPFDVDNQKEHELSAKLDAIGEAAKGLALYLRPATAQESSCPTAPLSKAEYIASRLDRQIAYYNTTADKLSVPSRWLHAAEFVLAAAAAVVTAIAAAVGKAHFDLASLTAVITTLGGTVLAHLQAARYDEQIVTYRTTADRLARLKATMPADQAVGALAAAAEDIIASETKSWQGLWSQEKK